MIEHSKNKIISWFELFENEIRPGKLQSSFQNKKAMQELLRHKM